jgi:hypothetical protein
MNRIVDGGRQGLGLQSVSCRRGEMVVADLLPFGMLVFGARDGAVRGRDGAPLDWTGRSTSLSSGLSALELADLPFCLVCLCQ